MLKNLFCFAVACLCLQSVIADVDFQQECVNAHNELRKLHGVPDLESDTALTEFAQELAEGIAKTGNLEHSPQNKFGENLWALFGTTSVDCHVAIKSFYDEIKEYDFSAPGSNGHTKHFTQVVWKDTERVGCAIAPGDNSAYVVCLYDPPGNYMGQFQEEVVIPKAE